MAEEEVVIRPRRRILWGKKWYAWKSSQRWSGLVLQWFELFWSLRWEFKGWWIRTNYRISELTESISWLRPSKAFGDKSSLCTLALAHTHIHACTTTNSNKWRVLID